MTNDQNLQIEVQRLHKLTVYGRSLTVMLVWIGVGSLSIWGLRNEIALWLENFTWAAVRYGLYFHRWPTFGLVFCLAITLVVFPWQSRNMLEGLPLQEKQGLEKKVRYIRQQGPSHPLWKWVCKGS